MKPRQEKLYRGFTLPLVRDERWVACAMGFPNHVAGEGCSKLLKALDSGNSFLPIRLDV